MADGQRECRSSPPQTDMHHARLRVITLMIGQNANVKIIPSYQPIFEYKPTLNFSVRPYVLLDIRRRITEGETFQ